MILNERIDEFIDRLNSSELLSDCKIIKAYPYFRKPTRLENTIIAISLGEINASNIELGGDVLNGSYIINASIYSPYGEADVSKTIQAVVDSQLSAYPSSISVSELNTNDSLSCVWAKCGFSFYDNISFGGSENE